MSETAPSDLSSEGLQHRPYRPARLPGLGVAAVLFILVYWLFLGLGLQEVDLSSPPAWWQTQAQTSPLLNALLMSLVTLVTEALSWRVFRHVLVPGLLGYWLAGQAASGFLRSFYNFPNRAEASGFLSRLRQHRQVRSSERRPDSPAKSSRTRLRPAMVLTLYTLPFASVFLLLLVYSFLSPPTSLRSTVYSVLIAGLGLLWGAGLIVYGLSFLRSGAPPSGLPLDRDALREMRTEHALLRVGGPGKVIVRNSDVAVTEYNGRFQRVLGPGGRMLNPYEYVRSIVDLRAHDCQGEITGLTEDGVEVTTNVTLTFRISSDDDHFNAEDGSEARKRPTRDRPYPYGERAVRAAAYAEIIGEDGKLSRWTSLPVTVAGEQFRELLARKQLEFLFDPELGESPPNSLPEPSAPHPELQKRLNEETEKHLRQYGIQLKTLNIGPLQAPEAVTAQNVRAWRSYWQKKMGDDTVMEPSSKGVDDARREAEVEMMNAIVDGVQHARQQSNGTPGQAVVALHLVEALERAASASLHESAEDGDVLNQLRSLRRQLVPSGS